MFKWLSRLYMVLFVSAFIFSCLFLIQGDAHAKTLFGLKDHQIPSTVFYGLVSALCLGFTQLWKIYAKSKMYNTKWASVFSVIAGIVFCVVDGFAGGTITNFWSAVTVVVAGFSTGAFSSGVFSSGKITWSGFCVPLLAVFGIRSEN